MRCACVSIDAGKADSKEPGSSGSVDSHDAAGAAAAAGASAGAVEAHIEAGALVVLELRAHLKPVVVLGRKYLQPALQSLLQIDDDSGASPPFQRCCFSHCIL